MQVIHLSFTEAGAAFARESLLAELIEIGLALSTLRWFGNWLKSHEQGVILNLWVSSFLREGIGIDGLFDLASSLMTWKREQIAS